VFEIDFMLPHSYAPTFHTGAPQAGIDWLSFDHGLGTEAKVERRQRKLKEVNGRE